MKKTKKALASLAIAGMALTVVPFNAFAVDTVPTRLAGTTAEQTAVKIADQTGWTGTAILASSASYGMVDALTAGPLASYLKAPILLTGAGNMLDAATKAELVKLKVTKVYVTSGTAVISQAVLNELVDMDITVTPLGGFDRAATSVNIASKMVGVTKVAVANGLQDALSIAAIASAANQPILLTNKDALPDSVATFLAANPSITASDVIGGTGIISDSVKAKLPSATRHAGYTAYDTNSQILQDFNASLAYENVYLASGLTGIDALAGAPLAAQTKSAIVLTDGTVPAAATFVNSKLTAKSVMTALGGTAVVPADVLAAIAYKAPVVIEVTSVAGISTKGVDVVLPTVTKAKEGFTIIVKKPDGTVVPLKPINIKVGDAAVSLEFVTALTSVTAGNWMVGGVTFDTGAQTAVQAVLDATTQVQLLNALKASYFTGVQADNIVTYGTILKGLTSVDKSTVALIQEKVIDSGNTATRSINFDELESIVMEDNIQVSINENMRLNSQLGFSKMKSTIKDMKDRLEDIDDERDGLDSTIPGNLQIILGLGAEKRALLDNIELLERNVVDQPTYEVITDLQASLSDDTQVRMAQSIFIASNQLKLTSADISLSIKTLENQLAAMQLQESLGMITYNAMNDLKTKIADLQTKLETTKLQQELFERQMKNVLNDQQNSLIMGDIPLVDQDFIVEDEATDLEKAQENSYTIKLQEQQLVILQSTLERVKKDNGISSNQYKAANFELTNATLKLTLLKDSLRSDYNSMMEDIAKKQSDLRVAEQTLKDKRVALTEAQVRMGLGMLTRLELDSAFANYEVQGNLVKTKQIEVFNAQLNYEWFLKGMPRS